MAESFVPAEFSVPMTLDGDGFRLEPLGPEHNERDHAAWMSSIDHIHATPGFEQIHVAGADEPRRQPGRSGASRSRLHQPRWGFTYSILDGDEVIGCVYIYPAGYR